MKLVGYEFSHWNEDVAASSLGSVWGSLLTKRCRRQEHETRLLWCMFYNKVQRHSADDRCMCLSTVNNKYKSSDIKICKTIQPIKWKLKKLHPASCTRNIWLCHSARLRPGEPHSQIHSEPDVRLIHRVLCFLLLLTLQLIFIKVQVSVSVANVQYLQIGQVCEGALVHRVHRQAVKPLKEKEKSLYVARRQYRGTPSPPMMLQL